MAMRVTAGQTVWFVDFLVNEVTGLNEAGQSGNPSYAALRNGVIDAAIPVIPEPGSTSYVWKVKVVVGSHVVPGDVIEVRRSVTFTTGFVAKNFRTLWVEPQPPTALEIAAAVPTLEDIVGALPTLAEIEAIAPVAINIVLPEGDATYVLVTYTSATELDLLFGATNISKWADVDNDEDATKIANRKAFAMAYAQEKVNDYLRNSRYKDQPFDPVPMMIRVVTTRLAGIMLYDARGFAEDKDVMSMHRKTAQAELRAIVNHSMKLDSSKYPNIPAVITEDDED